MGTPPGGGSSKGAPEGRRRSVSSAPNHGPAKPEESAYQPEQDEREIGEQDQGAQGDVADPDLPAALGNDHTEYVSLTQTT